MSTMMLPEPHRPQDLFDAWVSAAHDAKVALDSWMASATRDRGGAYVSYRASLDREQHAADVLAAAVVRDRPCGR